MCGHVRGVSIAQTADNECVIAGQLARVKFEGAGANKPRLFARVDEGHFDAGGKWIMERNWNGGQTDYGLNFTDRVTVLKVRVGTY